MLCIFEPRPRKPHGMRRRMVCINAIFTRLIACCVCYVEIDAHSRNCSYCEHVQSHAVQELAPVTFGQSIVRFIICTGTSLDNGHESWHHNHPWNQIQESTWHPHRVRLHFYPHVTVSANVLTFGFVMCSMLDRLLIIPTSEYKPSELSEILKIRSVLFVFLSLFCLPLSSLSSNFANNIACNGCQIIKSLVLTQMRGRRRGNGR
jgi:hypothetical protein